MLKRPYDIPEGSLEEVTKKRIKEYFKDNGIYFKMVQPSMMGSSVGMSDFQALHKGLFIAIEAKRNTKDSKPTPHQVAYLDEINSRGGLGMVVKCTDDIKKLDELLQYLGVL